MHPEFPTLEIPKKRGTNILFLTDSHFGRFGGMTDEQNKQDEVLESLIQFLRTLDEDSRPDAIVIGGDIGWSGHGADYSIAKYFIHRLLEALGLNPERLVVCAGNHDIEREIAHVFYRVREEDFALAQDMLRRKYLPALEFPFRNFSAFCKDLGIPPLAMDDYPNYLTGTRSIDGIRFIVLNSAWFCRGPEDRGRLLVGSNFIHAMGTHAKIIRGDLTEPLTIGVVHHPRSWLVEPEITGYAETPAMNSLARRTHLILSGHTHGAGRSLIEPIGNSHIIIGGATFDRRSNLNNAALLRFNENRRVCERILLEWRPVEAEWLRMPNIDTIHLYQRVAVAPQVAQSKDPNDITIRLLGEQDAN